MSWLVSARACFGAAGPRPFAAVRGGGSLQGGASRLRGRELPLLASAQLALHPLLGRAGGQADAAGRALAGRADPGDGDRVAGMEPGQDGAELVGGADGLPVDRGDDRPAGQAGLGCRAAADRPVDEDAGGDGRDGRGRGQPGVAGGASLAAPDPYCCCPCCAWSCGLLSDPVPTKMPRKGGIADGDGGTGPAGRDLAGDRQRGIDRDGEPGGLLLGAGRRCPRCPCR